MRRQCAVGTAAVLIVVLCCGVAGRAENIDPYGAGERFAWGENVGWLNFEPGAGSGVHVLPSAVQGFAWAENIGWINLSPAGYGGVVNDGSGNLSGFAWAENAGWINFDPDVPADAGNLYRVWIDADGKFGGWAWGENIGWIHFDQAQAWSARACVVGLVDLANFVSYWLQSGGVPANLDKTDPVNMNDMAILAYYWSSYCPDGWPLK
jgi:hypothetical protein